jgi:hypothetical protein
MSLLPVSEKFVPEFPSLRYLSSSGYYTLVLSSLGDPTGSNDTAGIALKVTGTHKTLHHKKVQIPLEGNVYLSIVSSDQYYLSLPTHVVLCRWEIC